MRPKVYFLACKSVHPGSIPGEASNLPSATRSPSALSILFGADRSSGPVCYNHGMWKAAAFGLGALRFAGVLVVGIFLLSAIQFVLLLSGGFAHELSRPIFSLGLLLVIILALRLAIRGNVTKLDRVAATAAAGSTAVGLTFVGIVAGTVLLGALVLSWLFLIAGGGDSVAAVFGPVAIAAGAIFAMAMLGARGLVYSGYRMWLSRSSSRWLGIASFILIFLSMLAIIRLV